MGNRLIDSAVSGPSRYMCTSRAPGNCLRSIAIEFTEPPERSTTTLRPSRPARYANTARYWSAAGRTGQPGISAASRSYSASASPASSDRVLWQMIGMPVPGVNRPRPYG
jgi:hypothetical protein